MKVVAVSRGASHRFSKASELSIRLIAGHGVEGDAHAGTTVKHRYFVARDPNRPNARQVHFIPVELLNDLRAAGFEIGPGEIGENILTEGVDLPAASTGTRVHLGDSAVVELTGLRKPCGQFNRFRNGLLDAVLARHAGTMAIVLTGGEVMPGDPIRLEPPAGPHRPLHPV